MAVAVCGLMGEFGVPQTWLQQRRGQPLQLPGIKRVVGVSVLAVRSSGPRTGSY